MTTGRATRQTRVAIGMAVATAASLTVALAMILLSGERAAAIGSIRLGEALALAVPWMAFSIVGALIVRHRSGHQVGWLCILGGFQVSVVALVLGIATYGLSKDPLAVFGPPAAWLAHEGSISIVIAPLLILYRFPTGQLPGPRWRPVEALAVAYVGALMLMFGIEPMPLLTFPTTMNPLAVGTAPRLSALALAPPAAFAALAVASLVVRFRRGSNLERRQLRLLALASVLVGVAIATMTLTSPELMTSGRLSTLTVLVNATAFTAIPAAIGIAIVRDRLYDIDRIVKRTLVYALVSAILVAVYVAAVLGLTALLAILAPDAGSTLATAGSTLLVAALFRPVRSRAQDTVDRRFDRERYEAARTIDTFAGLVRAEVELDAIVGDLRLAAARTVRPSTLDCWIRGPASGLASVTPTEALSPRRSSDDPRP